MEHLNHLLIILFYTVLIGSTGSNAVSSIPITTTPTPTTTTSTTTSTTTPTTTTPTTTTISTTTPTTTTPTPTTPTTTTPTPTTPTPTTTTPTPTTTTTQASIQLEISETNILLETTEDDLFVELKGTPSLKLNDVTFKVSQAEKVTEENAIVLNGSLNAEGMFLIDKTHFLNTSKILLMKSVLITLWVENKKLDSLFLSLSGENNTELSQTSTVFVDPKNSVPIKEKLSFSRCSQLTSRSFILTKETKNKDNYCPFNVTKALEMKLKAKEPGCLKGTIENINSSLNDLIIQLVDSKNVQFSSWFIVTGLLPHVGCVENTNEISAKFLFQANFQELLTAVVKEYQNQISTNTHVPFLQLSGYSWILNKCTEKCTSPVEPPNTDDDHIRLTVAVVVSCVGVFLLVLIFVIIYLKNKRRGIMQFHMTRLDDEDDLIGDMDDFVGNQGPTFKNYR